MNMATHMLPHDVQLSNEHRFSRKHIDKYIETEIMANPDMIQKIEEGVQLLGEYVDTTYSYESKNERVSHLRGVDLHELVKSVFITVAYCQIEELFTSISAQLAGKLWYADKRAAIQTMAEILAVLCQTDAFDICKASRSASLVIVSRIPLSEKLLTYVMNSAYLPPMVCAPNELTSNYSSGYLTHKDSLILKGYNHHNGDICLDTLNKMNQTELKLCTDFLSTVEEEPTFELDTGEKIEQWKVFKKQCYQFYSLIAKQGNKFHLTHKVCKRGRAYAQGYHISTQGTSFKKAMIELAKEDLVTGVPV